MEFLSSSLDLSFQLYFHYYLIAAVATASCLLLTVLSSRLASKTRKSDASKPVAPPGASSCIWPCTCVPKLEFVLLNGGASATVEMIERAPVGVLERQTGASMMEQLVPEIMTHALSYLDYRSLCRLSMTNSLMRKAANDDNAWKALYHKVRFLLLDALGSVASCSLNFGVVIF